MVQMAESTHSVQMPKSIWLNRNRWLAEHDNSAPTTYWDRWVFKSHSSSSLMHTFYKFCQEISLQTVFFTDSLRHRSIIHNTLPSEIKQEPMCFCAVRCAAYNIYANQIGSVFSDFQLCRCFIHTLDKWKKTQKSYKFMQKKCKHTKFTRNASHPTGVVVLNARVLLSPNLIPSLIIKQCLLFSFCE